MKKYLCFLLVLTMIFTMVMTAGAAGIEVRDLLDYMFDKNVDPYMYSGVVQSFLSFESDENGIYTLRSADDMEDMLLEIEVYLSQFGVTRDEVEPYVRHCHEFFSANPDLFTVFCGFMLNYNNIVLPFTMQSQFEEQLPTINSAIRDNFYCETFFLNFLSRINDEYYEEKKDAAFMYYNEEICIKNDAMDYVSFFEINDNSVISSAASAVESMLSIINSADFAEKSAFAEYMILMGIMSLNMDDSAVEEDPIVTSAYDEMAKIYAEGTEQIKPFYTIDSIITEYVPLINAASSQSAKNDVIYEAMSKAATVRILDGDNVNITDSEIFTFASLAAQQVRNKLVEKSITVSKVQPFAVRVLFENGDSKGFKLTVPKSGLSSAKTQYSDKFEILSPNGNLVADISGILASDAFSANAMSFEVLYDSADVVIPSLSKYAQGNSVLKIKAGNGKALLYDVMYFEKDVTGQENAWSENKVYSISDSGDREKVNNYYAYGSSVSFEIGSEKYFVKIDGTLEDFSQGTTAKPTPTPTPTSSPSGSEWIDHGTSDDSENDNKNDDTQSGTSQGGDDGGEIKPLPEKTPETTVAVSFADVTQGHWAKAYIEELAGKGILSGMGNNMFSPDNFVTREQFAKIISEAFGITDENATCDFADVEKGSWYEKYVASVFEKEIVNGVGGGAFGTGQYMTRQDMAVMILRCAHLLGIDMGTPSDYVYNDNGKISDYAKEAISALVGAGVISGFEDNTVRPLDNCTRAQVAKIISSTLAIKNR